VSRASEFPRDYDDACLQMRLSYSPAAHIFLFLVQWTDCTLAGALGLLRILIYKVCGMFAAWLSVFCSHCGGTWLNLYLIVQVYVDGTTTMSTLERRASIKEFYGRTHDLLTSVSC
jgi:hypothetical protein